VQVKCEKTGTAYICHLEGNLENLTVAEFRDALSGLPPAASVIFDMAGVSFIDSAGLGALIGAVRRAREAGGEAVVCRPRASVGRVLTLVGLPRIVHVARDLEEAAGYFSASQVA
jgi:anti-sigma B factor antagonist